MLSMRSQFAFVLGVGCTLLLVPGIPGIKGQDAPASQQAAATTAPAAFADSPPGQVVVTYLNGALTVKVNNAPLTKVLRAVCSQIGAELDFTSGADEPIFADLGPGLARKVIASLLEAAPYNYVMAHSADDQNSVINLVVFPRTEDSKAVSQVNQPPRPTRATSIGEKASPQKASESPTVARASLSATENGDFGDSNVADMVPDPKMADQLRELEAAAGRPRHRRR